MSIIYDNTYYKTHVNYRVQGNSSMRCLCRNQDMQIYDDTVAKYGSCRGLVGTPCDPEDTNSCVVGAQCEPTAEVDLLNRTLIIY